MDIFTKQPGETLDYDVDFTNFLGADDTLISGSATVYPETTADVSLTLNSTVVNTGSGVIKVWLSGGTSGNSYKVTVSGSTSVGRVKEFDFKLKVKDI